MTRLAGLVVDRDLDSVVDGGDGVTERHVAGFEIHVLPAQPECLAAPRAGCSEEEPGRVAVAPFFALEEVLESRQSRRHVTENEDGRDLRRDDRRPARAATRTPSAIDSVRIRFIEQEAAAQ
jgi:hypothetical protein